jgi:hypothetical protein
MGGPISSKSNTDRLSLAKQAIIMLLDKLQPNDAFSLITFNEIG